jgi:hypothetical protein
LRQLRLFSSCFVLRDLPLSGGIPISTSLYYACCLASALPYLAIPAILFHNRLRRALWRRGKNLRKPNPARCSTAAALGATLLFAQIFYRPSMAHVAELRQQTDVDEDDSGDPESPDKLLHRQLRRIRRGEPVERLTLRLSDRARSR